MRTYVIFYALAALAGLLWFLVFRYGFDRRTLRILLGCDLCAIALWTWQVSEPAVLFSDFNVAYYPAGRAILEAPALRSHDLSRQTTPPISRKRAKWVRFPSLRL